MALSHHEPRALERIAVDPSAEDPWLASTLVHDGWNATSWRQRLSAAVLFVVGMPTLASATFVPRSIPGGIFAVSILGSVIMFDQAVPVNSWGAASLTCRTSPRSPRWPLSMTTPPPELSTPTGATATCRRKRTNYFLT